MVFSEQFQLKACNTFGIRAKAEFFAEITELSQLNDFNKFCYPIRILGGGSNVLLCGDVSGLVLHNCLKKKQIIRESEEYIWIEVQSGEIWHDFVMWAVGRGWGGVENLALIPGTVGAAPVQNIGAYGAEVQNVIDTVNFYDWEKKCFSGLSAKECLFGYRDSIFKRDLKDKVFITSVVFKLHKKAQLNTSYGAIRDELQKMGVEKPDLAAVATAVMNIRRSKLPDPAVIGNAGSFFKNPVIPEKQFQDLKNAYPFITSYAGEQGMVKIPAGWLIEQCGWKGYRHGYAGVHALQALVLVNYGNASGRDILNLSEQIMISIKERFGILLEREVQVWGQD